MPCNILPPPGRNSCGGPDAGRMPESCNFADLPQISGHVRTGDAGSAARQTIYEREGRRPRRPCCGREDAGGDIPPLLALMRGSGSSKRLVLRRWPTPLFSPCPRRKPTIPSRAEQKENFMSTADILRQEGQLLARQQDVIEALEIRFDWVPDGLREEISRISDSARLHVLLRAAIRCADLESFVKDL